MKIGTEVDTGKRSFWLEVALIPVAFILFVLALVYAGIDYLINREKT